MYQARIELLTEGHITTYVGNDMTQAIKSLDPYRNGKYSIGRIVRWTNGVEEELGTTTQLR